MSRYVLRKQIKQYVSLKINNSLVYWILDSVNFILEIFEKILRLQLHMYLEDIEIEFRIS